MKHRVDPETLRCLKAIRQALLKEWDPLRIQDFPESQNDYNPFVAQIYSLLTDDRGLSHLIDFLWWLETEHLGLPGQRAATESFARRLMEIKEASDREGRLF